MTTATKIFTFDSAHMLANHTGLCKNLHGHTYTLEVTSIRNTNTYSMEDTISKGPSEGMVVDFSDLKLLVKETILDEFDHAFIANINSDCLLEKTITDALLLGGAQVAAIGFRPTAELMAQHFMGLLNAEAEARNLNILIAHIRLYETPTSYAEVTYED